ncbi:hypothetical protein SKAU_G00299960 [Synaphobranchus kaupii]|uniref:DDE Tnp4 domain-containing protein n=1 Tax=Synaphobranchus kaupii TaxID=118154 RepID=A0A9Q1EVJ2_SYNKA|nr:hypothetical protein SKAU_G00299960 [Synaphobranchus kaupii]
MEESKDYALSLVTTTLLAFNMQVNDQFLHSMLLIQNTHRRVMDRLRSFRTHSEAARRRRRRKYRRLQIALMTEVMARTCIEGATCKRRVWQREGSRGREFWTSFQDGGDDKWLTHLRMSRSTFEYIAEQLRPALQKQKTNFRSPIDHRTRLAVVLWWFATQSEYRSVAILFGIGISTVCGMVRQVTKAVLGTLKRRLIYLPTGDQLDEAVQGFETLGCPQCAGVIEGIHIPIIAPNDNPEDYLNRKGCHSVVLQAVVDHRFCFTDIFVSVPGRTHDAEVLTNSDIFNLAEHSQNGSLFPPEKARVVNEVDVPVHLIGGPAYPLKRWIMTAFPQDGQLTAEQRMFNARLSSARARAKTAFGRLKGRWKFLAKRNDVAVGTISDIVAACCILHNVCELRRDRFLPEWDVREHACVNLDALDEREDGGGVGEASAIRDAVMTLMCDT